MDRSDKLEAVDHLHKMAKNLRLMRKSFALLSAAKSRAENIKAVLAALKKGFPQLTMCFVLQALGQNEEFPACDGPARVVACGARRFAMSHWAHSETVLAASQKILTSDRIGANSDLWRISYLLRGALRSSITGCLDCIVVFRDMKRDEGFVLLESVPSKGPVYASDGATRVVLDDRTHPETDVLMPCAQVRAKLRVYEKAQCAALKCLRTGKGPLTDPPRTRAADLVQFSMEDLCLEAQKKSWLAQTCMPILTTSDNGVEPLASLCILSEDPLEGLEIDKLEAAALAVTSTLESACKRFVARRARLAASIELQTKIDARRDERAALQAFSDILSIGVAQNPHQIQQHLSECAVSCLATETLPRIWLREDCATLLRDAKVSSESSSARLVALAENDSNSLEKRDFETAFFEPIVLEDATRILVPLIAQPEGDFLGLVESASPLLRSLEERRETNLHSAGGIAAKRWIVHTMHFANIAADLLRAGLLHRHVDFLQGSLRPGVESIRDRLRQVSQEDGGLAALVPSVRDMQMDGMRVAMRYFVVLARALVGAAGASAFAFDNTLDPTDLHEIHNSGLPDALLTNPDALYLQRRLGNTLVLRAIPTDEAQRLVPDRDFDGDLLGATEARRAANEGKADGAAQEEIRTIHTFSDPRKSQGRDALADELSNLRITASDFANEDDTPIESSKDDDARSPHADDRSTSRSRHYAVQPDHAQLHDNASQDKLKDEKDEEMEEGKTYEDEKEEDEEGDEQVVDSQSSSAVNLLDSLICGVEHQCTRHRPSVSVRIRQSEIEADMALRQRRFWNARAGAILQLSRFRVPHETEVGSPSETDLSEEEKAKIRMAKLKEETADGVVPDARKFVRLAVKRFIEDETLRQDRERQTKLHRRKENRDWATMVANTDVQARLLAPSDGSARGSRLSFKVSPRRRSGIRQNSFVLRRRGNFDAVDEDLNAIKEDSKASKLAMQKMNMLMTKDA
ncbi:Hypothetical Protein FCC1311_038872 [Hondaea fermentalgiana]|uniref:Uncharacterized protein n=1 Tax=Hondaea fermentalgiana TaxID=2315210 RepID=A0A2R5GIG3_9STRA|nr:Hypothetical Protein FCC1311_038872 [Hondaea fermentalgiana]|eukprot:GBG27664.1 Hypothetical Protein FCC1311_038872 [Hondaea fermentalgiana]